MAVHTQSNYPIQSLGFLALSISLHLVVMFLAVRDEWVSQPLSRTPLQITFESVYRAPAKETPVDISPIAASTVPPERTPKPTVTAQAADPAKLELGEFAAEAHIPKPEALRPSISSTAQPSANARILSSQFNLEIKKNHNPFSSEETADAKTRQLGLAEFTAVNSMFEPAHLQLPFKDTRIYLVDSYDAGLLGSIERFFDKATVPFGWTTKGATRIQCAWLMVIAGCSWGDKELFYRKAHRRKDPGSGQEDQPAYAPPS